MDGLAPQPGFRGNSAGKLDSPARPRPAIPALMRPAPFIPRRQPHSETAVVDAKESVGCPRNRIRIQLRDFLSHDSDILGVAPEVAIPVQAQAGLRAADQVDVTLQPDV